MLEACFEEAKLLKNITETLKEMFTSVNFDCTSAGLSLQSMDSSHVALVDLMLRAEGFDSYRCDRSIPIGMSLASLTKILKCASPDDSVTLKAEDSGDTLNLVFESKNKERVSDYDMKLLALDIDRLELPEIDPTAVVNLSSTEFQKITRDLGAIGESITFDITKESIRFTVEGEVGTGNVILKPTNAVDMRDNDCGTSLSVQKPLKLTLSSKYINMITKASCFSPGITLHLAEGAPVLFEFKIADFGHLRFWLAPKIGEE